MKVKDVILKYHKICPFPWTPAKVKKAGYEVMPLARCLGQELGQCEDKDTPGAKAVLDALKDMGIVA